MSDKETMARYWTYWYERHSKEAAEAKRMAEDCGATFQAVAPEAQRKEAFEDAAQHCRYYLKHQNFPSSWETKDEYQRGAQIVCENLEKIMLEEASKCEPQNRSGA